MIDAQSIPETLAFQAEARDEDHSEWTALVTDGDGSRMYRWKLDPEISFGRENLEHWITRIVQRHGYPVRVQWRRAGGALIHDQPIWGSEDESQEGGFAAAMVPSAFSGVDVEHEATTPIERLVKLFVEQPEVAANAIRMIMEPFFRRTEQRDAELIRLASAHSAKAAASAAAAAVEQKLSEMAAAAGYELDENGNPIDDLDDELDYEDDEVVDFGDAATDEGDYDMYASRTARLADLEAESQAIFVEREKLIQLNAEADKAEWEAASVAAEAQLQREDERAEWEAQEVEAARESEAEAQAARESGRLELLAADFLLEAQVAHEAGSEGNHLELALAATSIPGQVEAKAELKAQLDFEQQLERAAESRAGILSTAKPRVPQAELEAPEAGATTEPQAVEVRADKTVRHISELMAAELQALRGAAPETSSNDALEETSPSKSDEYHTIEVAR